jgi:hypothetical protein
VSKQLPPSGQSTGSVHRSAVLFSTLLATTQVDGAPRRASQPPGASPLDASFGRQKRHRLNRRGDREAKSALFRKVLCRLIRDEETRAYIR